MIRTSLKTKAEIPVFTGKNRHAIIAGAGGNRQSPLFQRHILAKITDFNTGVLALLLGDYFPDRQFVPQKNAGGDLDILDYVVRRNGAWTLDIEALSRSKKKHLANLIHDEANLWNEAEAREKYGCADITRFFIDVENDRFFAEFSNLKNAKLADIKKDDIPKKFLQGLSSGNVGYKPVWEDWDFSMLVLHKPHTIYKAFCYYAHRYYTLMGLGLCKLSEEKPNALQNCGTAELLSAGEKLVDALVLEQIPEMADMGLERRFWLFQLVQEILESVPIGASLYSPTDKNVFVNQLASAIPGFLRSKRYDVDSDKNNNVFSPKEIRNIKNHMDKIGQYIDNVQDNNEYRSLIESGTLRKKAEFLRRLVQKPSIRGHYSERELGTIEGFFNEKSSLVSLFTPVQGKEADESSYLIDILDIEELGVDEAAAAHLDWIVFFEDIFKIFFDESKLKIFLECIPDHFNNYPLEEDSAGNIKMSRYSKQMLFSTSCIVTGIKEDKELWTQFLGLIQKAIVNINKARSIS